MEILYKRPCKKCKELKLEDDFADDSTIEFIHICTQCSKVIKQDRIKEHREKKCCDKTIRLCERSTKIR
jgi:hypothetical protein